MLDRGLEQTLNTIQDLKNPEIHHYHRGSHPGIKWYIKTVIPGPAILNSDTYKLFNLWKYLESRFPKLIKLVDKAYDWQGEPINGWWTIWLDNQIDIRLSWTRKDGFIWKIVDFDIGLNVGATDTLELIKSHFGTRQSEQSSVCYDELCGILEYLKTWSSDSRSKTNRKNLRIIDSVEICSETVDRTNLDFNV